MAVLFVLNYCTQNIKFLPYTNISTHFTQICLHSATILNKLVLNKCLQPQSYEKCSIQTWWLYHLLKYSRWMCDAFVDAARFDVRKLWSLCHSCRFHFSRCHGQSPDGIWWQTASMDVEGRHRQLIHSIWFQVTHYSVVICCWNLVKKRQTYYWPYDA